MGKSFAKAQETRTSVKAFSLNITATDYDEIIVRCENEEELDALASKIVGFLNSEGVEIEFSTPDAEPKAQTTKTSKKSSAKTSSKKSAKKSSNDDFDRDKYLAIGKKIGAVGARGSVYKACRPYVYAVMDGDMTEAQAKRKVAAYTATFTK